jgi:cellulose synthase/poly-beta-1,6-N-acetylglucosamine synthase-like glycosyltransferase
MAYFLSVLIILVVVIIARLFWLGRRYILRGEPGAYLPAPGPWPQVAVIIPVAGAGPDLEANLRSRLNQDYPHYQVIFATRSQDDPATPVIAALLPDFPQARLIYCGPASGCSQKNHNLLTGLRAIAPETAILVFGDANQTAPPHWLQALVAPLRRGEAVVASGFHHIIPRDTSLATLGRSFTVLMIYLGKGVAKWDQPWGGATAITTEAFTRLKVDRLWARTVVDDVTLARRLQEAGLKMAPAPGAALATPARETLASWQDWFIRQIIYLKFYFPVPWRLAGVGLFFLLGLILLSLGHLGLAVLGWLPWDGAALSVLILLTLTAFMARLRPLHPCPGPWLSYLLAGYLTLPMAAWCHAQTWFTRQIRWRRLVYTVDRQGLVTRIQEIDRL